MTRNLRAVILGTAVVSAAWLAARGIPTAAAWVDALEDSVEVKAAKMHAAEREIATIPALADSMAHLGATLAFLPRTLLRGSDSSTARLDLQHRLVTAGGGASEFTLASRVDTVGPLRSVQGSIEFTGRLEELLILVESLERDPNVLVDSLYIASAADPTPGSEERLLGTIIVRGWYAPKS